jgi:DNA-binding transcriptional MerR regulator
VATIRRWHRRGLIVPAREVRRLPYFDFQEVATARRLAQLLAAGASPAAVEKKLAELSRFVPEVQRPLAQLSVIVEGRQLLLRQGEGLIEPGGQMRFDFEALEQETEQAVDADAQRCDGVARGLLRPNREAAVGGRDAGALPASWRMTVIWNKRSRCTACSCPPSGPYPKSVFNWPNCCIGWAISRPRGNATTWRSNWTRTSSKLEPTWAVSWPNRANSSWPSPRSKAPCVIMKNTPTSTTTWLAPWTIRIAARKPSGIG